MYAASLLQQKRLFPGLDILSSRSPDINFDIAPRLPLLPVLPKSVPFFTWTKTYIYLSVVELLPYIYIVFLYFPFFPPKCNIRSLLKKNTDDYSIYEHDDVCPLASPPTDPVPTGTFYGQHDDFPKAHCSSASYLSVVLSFFLSPTRFIANSSPCRE